MEVLGQSFSAEAQIASPPQIAALRDPPVEIRLESFRGFSMYPKVQMCFELLCLVIQLFFCHRHMRRLRSIIVYLEFVFSLSNIAGGRPRTEAVP